MSGSWSWDVTLYAGAAPHYVAGRRPYPQELADTVRDELGLDGTGRLLDVGCGPGPLTALLAPLFAEAVGVDADPEMIEVARAAHPEIRWVRRRGEELDAELGLFDVVSFAQSFHWMDQPVVARAARNLLKPGGHWVQVHASTHRGDDDVTVALPYPQPPWTAIDALIERHLGPVRRAGQGSRLEPDAGSEDEAVAAAGFRGPRELEIPQGQVVVRPAAEVVSAVLSLSYAAPHLFGEGLGTFVREMEELLVSASPDGLFAEQARSIAVVIWQR